MNAINTIKATVAKIREIATTYSYAAVYSDEETTAHTELLESTWKMVSVLEQGVNTPGITDGQLDRMQAIADNALRDLKTMYNDISCSMMRERFGSLTETLSKTLDSYQSATKTFLGKIPEEAKAYFNDLMVRGLEQEMLVEQYPNNMEMLEVCCEFLAVLVEIAVESYGRFVLEMEKAVSNLN